jgi:hypothetical protein
MNVTRMLLAAAGGFVAYFAFGFLTFGALPMLREEFARYPAIYRDHDSIKAVMPIGMLGILVAIVALAYLYASLSRSGGGLGVGLKFGAVIGVFVLGAFVLHNYVNLNIGWRLTLAQGVAYFVEWLLVGAVIGLIYRPLGA